MNTCSAPVWIPYAPHCFLTQALRKLSFHSCLDCLLFRRLLVRSPAPAAVDVPVGEMLNPRYL